jgi:hypothetical protein
VYVFQYVFNAFYAFYALGILFSVIGGPCKRYAVTPTRMPGHVCLPGPHSMYVCQCLYYDVPIQDRYGL